MEQSAWVYILLTAVTVTLGLWVDNREYVSGYIRGGRRCLTRWDAGGGIGICDRQRARNRVAAAAVYCLMTAVSACRIAVGNDYWVYRDNFKLIAQKRHVASEFGFNYIVEWLQKLFGYDNYLPVFAFFSIVTVWFFVKALHDQGQYFAFSLYLLMTGGYYFNSLNSVRYYLALAMALFSMKYVLRGEYGKFILIILAGAMFHKSVLLVIPTYLAARILAAAPLKRRHYIAGLFLLVCLVFGQELCREIIFFFYPFYRDSAFDTGQISYANILKCGCVAALGLICCRQSLREDLANRFYFFLNLFGLVIYCCGSFIPEVSRVGYYMIISQVFLLPGLLAQIPGKGLRRLCYVGVILAFAGYFFLLLKGMYAMDVRLLPYRNWIFN
ncbi:MAG: EpsG family protein [Lachnospiraceae bacterium]|nr:EpsG family protein [Lachnospiraceae bacterium]